MAELIIQTVNEHQDINMKSYRNNFQPARINGNQFHLCVVQQQDACLLRSLNRKTRLISNIRKTEIFKNLRSTACQHAQFSSLQQKNLKLRERAERTPLSKISQQNKELSPSKYHKIPQINQSNTISKEARNSPQHKNPCRQYFSSSLHKLQRYFSKNQQKNINNLSITKLLKKSSKQSTKYEPFSDKELEVDVKLLIKNKPTTTKLMICKNTLAFIEVSVEILEIQKIKILPLNNNRDDIWLKINTRKGQTYHFQLLKTKKPQKLIEIMHQIINKKIFSQTTTNLFLEHPTYTADEIISNSWIYGKIYQKSQFLKKWNHRLVAISDNGIYLYNNPYLLHAGYQLIPRKAIKYVWTRFQVVYDNYVVVKIKYGLKQIQFGVPGCEVCVQSDNWFKQFCRLLL